MQWSWKHPRAWLRAWHSAWTAARTADRRDSDITAWRRLSRLRPTATPWTVAALGRDSVARAGTRPLIHLVPSTAPGRFGVRAPYGNTGLPPVPAGRADALVGAVRGAFPAAPAPTAPAAGRGERGGREPESAHRAAGGGAVRGASVPATPGVADGLRGTAGTTGTPGMPEGRVQGAVRDARVVGASARTGASASAYTGVARANTRPGAGAGAVSSLAAGEAGGARQAARAEGSGLPVMAVRRVSAARTATSGGRAALTHATDDRVGTPRPVTPPPVRTRSDFERALDAYRPDWLLPQVTADDGLPSYVQARRHLATAAAESPSRGDAGAGTPGAVGGQLPGGIRGRTPDAGPGAVRGGVAGAAQGWIPGAAQAPTPGAAQGRVPGGTSAPAGAGAGADGTRPLVPRRPRRHPQGYERATAPTSPGLPATANGPSPFREPAPTPHAAPSAHAPQAPDVASAPGAPGLPPAPQPSTPDTQLDLDPGELVGADTPTEPAPAPEAPGISGTPGTDLPTVPADVTGPTGVLAPPHFPGASAVPGSPAHRSAADSAVPGPHGASAAPDDGPDPGTPAGPAANPVGPKSFLSTPGWEAAWSLRLSRGHRDGASHADGRATPYTRTSERDPAQGTPSAGDDEALASEGEPARAAGLPVVRWTHDPAPHAAPDTAPHPAGHTAPPALGTAVATTVLRRKLPVRTARSPRPAAAEHAPPPLAGAFPVGLPAPDVSGTAPYVAAAVPAVFASHLLRSTAVPVPHTAVRSPDLESVGQPAVPELVYAVPPTAPAPRGSGRTTSLPLPEEGSTEPFTVDPVPWSTGVGGTAPPDELLTGRYGSARSRAARRWFCAPLVAPLAQPIAAPMVLPHVLSARAVGHDAASLPEPGMSWTIDGGPPQVRPPDASWTGTPPPGFAAQGRPGPAPPSPSGPASSGPSTAGGSGGGSGPGHEQCVALHRTQEWADLLALLAAHRRQRPFGFLDDPAVLDALAGRLHERVLARIRRELVVDRERSGLLVPRT
ncbi:hypothetical protein [Streptomyces cadmiisoli]|uniref:hypothetical protein n=1 Tax=Streptomyces cadmiisoli TaxID=2184053 RepID=UPI00365E85DD